jgi:hypothetical protein
MLCFAVPSHLVKPDGDALSAAEESFCERARFSPDQCSDPNLVSIEPALFGFQNVADVR